VKRSGTCALMSWSHCGVSVLDPHGHMGTTQ
jgi:hypothetical protein